MSSDEEVEIMYPPVIEVSIADSARIFSPLPTGSVSPPTLEPIDEVRPKQKAHPVATATLEHFIIKEDGKEYFKIDDKEYLARKVANTHLRRFATHNAVKKSDPPYHSLSRSGTQCEIIDEILLKISRRDNGEPDPWERKKAPDGNKHSFVNRYRLANVIFSQRLREAVLNKGRALTKDELDRGLKTDQKLYEKIAEEYNKLSVDEYDDIQYSIKISEKNLPTKFTRVDWVDISKAWKDSMQNLDKAIQQQNVSGKNDSDENEDSDGCDDPAKTKNNNISKFTNVHFVVYWHHFVEDHPNMLKAMNTELPECVFNETESKSGRSNRSCRSASKRKSTDIAETLRESNAVEKKRLVLQEQCHELDSKAYELKVKRAVAAGKQSNAIQRVARTDSITKWTQESNRLTNIYNAKKKEFAEHCKIHPVEENRDHKARRKGHRERVALKGDNTDSDSEDSLDTQAALLNVIDSTGAQLTLAKKELKAAIDWAVDDNGNGS